MPDITVTVTDTQKKCLEYAANGVQTWCDNAIHSRAMAAQQEIIALLVEHCNANTITIATGVDAQITQAYDLKVVKTGAERQAEIDAASPA